MKEQDLFLETASKYSFDDTVQKLTDKITEMGWKMPAVHDLQQTMKNFGKDVLPVKVLELCHPRHSSRILEMSDERIVSSLMPCRISVYQKADGITYISRINSGALAEGIGGLIMDVMHDSTHDIEMIIKNVLNQ